MAQGELFPKEEGWEYGSVLPLAQRPIPYAGALAPELALPDIVRSPINELTKALTLPQRTMLGQAMPDAASATEFALALTGSAGLMTRAQPNSLGAMMGWHGTPHRFEPVEHNPFGEFRDSNIGTGEGAQVYGWGHYVAGKKEVAEAYQKSLAGVNPDADQLSDALHNTEIRLKLVQDEINHPGNQKLLQEGKLLPGWLHNRQEDLSFLQNRADMLKEQLKTANQLRGSLYQVHIKPDEHELLDWDKPLSEQPSGIQAKLNESRLVPKLTITDEQIAEARDAGWEGTAGFLEAQRHFLKNRWNMTGGDWYNTHAGEVGKATASYNLHEAGIPGIKYLDQGSRNLRSTKEIQDDIEGLTEEIPYAEKDLENEIDPKSREQTIVDIKTMRRRLAGYKRELETAKNPTSNYVIFHPKNLKITGRNGEELPVELVEHDPFQPPVSSEGLRLLRGMDWNEELENMKLGLGPFSPGSGVKKRPGANR